MFLFVYLPHSNQNSSNHSLNINYLLLIVYIVKGLQFKIWLYTESTSWELQDDDHVFLQKSASQASQQVAVQWRTIKLNPQDIKWKTYRNWTHGSRTKYSAKKQTQVWSRTTLFPVGFQSAQFPKNAWSGAQVRAGLMMNSPLGGKGKIQPRLLSHEWKVPVAASVLKTR